MEWWIWILWRACRGDPASGREAVQLRVAENDLTEFGKLAQEGNTLILPAALSDVGSMVSLAMNVIKQQENGSAAKA